MPQRVKVVSVFKSPFRKYILPVGDRRSVDFDHRLGGLIENFFAKADSGPGVCRASRCYEGGRGVVPFEG